MIIAVEYSCVNSKKWNQSHIECASIRRTDSRFQVGTIQNPTRSSPHTFRESFDFASALGVCLAFFAGDFAGDLAGLLAARLGGMIRYRFRPDSEEVDRGKRLSLPH